jgi:hypothetical protein
VPRKSKKKLETKFNPEKTHVYLFRTIVYSALEMLPDKREIGIPGK